MNSVLINGLSPNYIIFNIFIPTAADRQSWVMDPIIEKAKDSYLVFLGEGCRRRRFPSRD